jgi:predicted PurR-regulated permease PerM
MKSSSSVHNPSLQKALRLLLFLFLGVAGLYYAKPFLVPVCFAVLFAMLFVPLSRRLEKMGLNRGLASLCCIILFLLVIAGIIMIVAWQVTNLTNDLGNLEGKIQSLVRQISLYLSEAFGISDEKQQEMLDKQSEKATGFIGGLSISLVGLIVNFILVLVYIFLFLFYRTHIKKFILQLVPQREDENTEDAIKSIEKVSQQYLTGIGMMIFCLWIMYGIGFTIVGLKNAIFFALLCGIFEIVPFIGNLTGNTLAALMALTQGGGFPMVIGILITYSLVQFLQSYILEPLVVGTGVNINPLFTIVGLVLGELLWGIAGLVLAIPLLAIVKIVCDHIPALQPYGFLIGREKKNKGNFADKVRAWFK